MAKKKKGKLTVLYGPMFSGKTNWLVDHYDDKTLVFKPLIDDRYNHEAVIHSHDDREVDAVLVRPDQPKDVLVELDKKKDKRKSVIFVDEIQFFDSDLLSVVRRLMLRNYDVVMAGLLLDSEGNDFGPTRQLLQEADGRIEFFADCDFEGCDGRATMTYSKIKKELVVMVGASDIYGTACEKHYPELHTK